VSRPHDVSLEGCLAGVCSQRWCVVSDSKPEGASLSCL